jgi:hypothetical protein
MSHVRYTGARTRAPSPPITPMSMRSRARRYARDGHSEFVARFASGAPRHVLLGSTLARSAPPPSAPGRSTSQRSRRPVRGRIPLEYIVRRSRRGRHSSSPVERDAVSGRRWSALLRADGSRLWPPVENWTIMPGQCFSTPLGPGETAPDQRTRSHRNCGRGYGPATRLPRPIR